MTYMYKSKKVKKIFLIINIIILFIGGITVFNIYNTIDINTYKENTEQDTVRSSNVREKENTSKTATEIIQDNIECVVGISKIKDIGSTIFLNDSVNKLGIGSGIIVTEDGYILTNAHVSGNKFEKCYVTFENGSNYIADVIWSDNNLDLSVIKINVTGLKCANLGESNNIKIGENVYAIGNPIGFEFQKTVTSGIISGINRTIKFEDNNETVYMSNLIQTDATINPGNSGGPLINIDGEVIGITSVKITSAERIGFAIPINIIKPIIQKLKSEGKFEEAIIGIFAYDKDVIPYLNNNISFENGIYVESISQDSPTRNAGLREGDIITKIDDIYLAKMSDLKEYIYTKNPGDEVNLTILRNRKQLELKIKLFKK